MSLHIPTALGHVTDWSLIVMESHLKRLGSKPTIMLVK